MLHRPALALAALTLSTLAAQADPLDARAARPLLFPATGVEVVQHDVSGLDPQQLAALMQVAQTQKYYAAVAFAPDAGILAEPTVLAANYHTPEAAVAAAMAGCNGRRHGGRACELALEVRPAGWEPRALSLSADATTGFEEQYRRAGGQRAFAASTSSGLWGIGRGRDAAAEAIAACRGDSEVSDCAVVIAD